MHYTAIHSYTHTTYLPTYLPTYGYEGNKQTNTLWCMQVRMCYMWEGYRHTGPELDT